ncbi:MAG: O-antigen ligase family protein [Saprospiraceae bacterium]
MVSIAFVGLVFISIFSFFQDRKLTIPNRLFIFPIALFFTFAISLFYTHDFIEGLDVLSSQIEFLAIPFIFLINQVIIKEKFQYYIRLLTGATSIAAFITFIFFLLPAETNQNIAANISLLKDYVVHEKALAFGVYSPFTERLQFSYLIGVAIFLQLWLFLKRYTADGTRLTVGCMTVNGLKLLVLVGTLLILGARGAQLSFLGASIIWIIGGYFHLIHSKLSKKVNAFFAYAVLILGLVVFLIITPFFAYQKIPAVKVRYDQMRWEIGTFQDGTFSNYEYTHFTSVRRLLSWKNSWAIIQENPILGVGIGDYQAAMEKEYAKDDLGFPVNTQSQFLYYWTASGLLSFVIFFSCLGYSFLMFFRQKDYWFKLLGMSFLVFYSLLFLFDAPLNFQVGAMTFLTIFCLLGTNIEGETYPFKK